MTPAPPDAPFGRLLTAMATPFTRDGAIDVDGVQKVAVHLVDHGHDGVVVSGTTGESPTTDPAETGEVLRAVVEAVGDRAHVVAGVGSHATAHSVELAEQARRLGADGVLLVTPYYNKPSPEGVIAHFTEVTRAADLPVMLYDVPGRTALRIAPQVYERMRELEQVVAVKDATGDLPGAARLVDLGYAVYSGDDVATLGYLAYGACGLVSVVGHAAGTELRAMIDAFVAGDHATALSIHQRLLPAFEAVMGVPNYGATTAKGALELLGVISERTVRGPLVALDDDEMSALRRGLEAAGLR